MTESLWPAQLLLPLQASRDKSATGFRVLWMVYFVAACIFGFLVLWLLVHYCLRDLIKVLDSHIPCTISLGIEVLFLVGCTIILAKIIGAHRTGRALEVNRKTDPEAPEKQGRKHDLVSARSVSCSGGMMMILHGAVKHFADS